jgi:hypothetical protein
VFLSFPIIRYREVEKDSGKLPAKRFPGIPYRGSECGRFARFANRVEIPRVADIRGMHAESD